MPILVATTTEPLPETPPTPGVEFGIATDTLALTWTGWNGDVWQIQGDPRSLARLEVDGRVGFGMPPITHYFTRSATTDGAQWQGYRVDERPFEMPLFVTGATPTLAREEQSRFMSTLRPDKRGVLTVADPVGNRRHLQLRYFAGADEEIRQSTYGLYWYSHRLRMIAEEPYYYGDTTLKEFAPDASVNFYGGGVGTLGPPFYIGSSSTTDSAVLTNPGDVDAWPVWTVHGPFTSFVGGVGGALINLPIAKGAGEWIKIDTTPSRQTIVDHTGANMWPNAGAVEFASIPAASTTVLTLTLAGTGVGTKVEVEFTPQYWTAW